jgi:hypothetical protein
LGRQDISGVDTHSLTHATRPGLGQQGPLSEPSHFTRQGCLANNKPLGDRLLGEVASCCLNSVGSLTSGLSLKAQTGRVLILKIKSMLLSFYLQEDSYFLKRQ